MLNFKYVRYSLLVLINLSFFTSSFSQLPDGYCYPGQNTGGYDFISRVSLGKIDYSNNIDSDTYLNYTADTADVEAGVEQFISMIQRVERTNTRATVYIDWNRDGDFKDANEAVFRFSGADNDAGKKSFTGTFIPPIGAVPGLTKMRIRYQNYDYPEACDERALETEDYILNILPPITDIYCATSMPISKEGARVERVTITNAKDGALVFENISDNRKCQTHLDYHKKTGEDPISMDLNDVYNIEVQLGSCDDEPKPQTARIYLDLNRDGLFDGPGELIGASGTVNEGGVFSTQIKIPGNAIPGGELKMRVITAQETHPGPCDGYENGETEEYNVKFNFISTVLPPRGSAIEFRNSCYELTQNTGYQVGAVWMKEGVSLEEPFDIRVNMNFGSNFCWKCAGSNATYPEAGGGADGIAFVIHNQGNIDGINGSGIGFGGDITSADPDDWPIQPSVGFELDTYTNTHNGDPDYDHIGYIENGDLIHGDQNLYEPLDGEDPFTVQVQDGDDYEARFTWDPVSETLKAYFNYELKLEISKDLVSEIFQGDVSNITYGFTSSTGSEYEVHKVCKIFSDLFTIPADEVICEGDQIDMKFDVIGLDNFEEVSYQWSVLAGDDISSLSDATVRQPIANPIITTTYLVNVNLVDKYQDTTVLVDTVQIAVDPLVDPNTLVDKFYCTNDESFNLYELLPDLPARSGIWTGPGATFGGYLGTIDVTSAIPGEYVYFIPPLTCGDGTTFRVNLQPARPLYTINKIETCGDGTGNYTVTFEIVEGDSLTYNIFSTTGHTGNLSAASPWIFTSDPIPSNEVYQFYVTDTAACDTMLVSGVEICECKTAGILAGGSTICNNGIDEADLVVEFIGEAPFSIKYVVDDIDTILIENILDTTYTFTDNRAGIYTLTEVIDANCPAKEDNISGFGSIIVNEIPTSTIVNGSTICDDGNSIGTIEVSFDGAAPWSITYANDQGDTATIDGITDNPFFIASNVSGEYKILNISDVNCLGTVDSSLARIDIFDRPTATISGGDTICNTGSVDLTVEFTGLAPFTFVYSINGIPDTANPVTTSDLSYTLSVTQEGTYTIAGITDGNCLGTTSGYADVQYHTPPTSTIQGGGAICADGSEAEVFLGFTGTAPWEVTYSVNGLEQLPITIPNALYLVSSSIPGNYTITNLSDANCPGTHDATEVEITLNILPSASISGDTIVCKGDLVSLPVSLTGTAPWTFSYTFDNDTTIIAGVTTSPFSLNVDKAGDYTLLTVKDANCNGTISNATAQVDIHELPTGDISGNEVICNDGSTVAQLDLAFTGESPWMVTYNLNGIDQVSQQFTDANSILESLESGSYLLVEVIDGNGCVAKELTGIGGIGYKPSPRAIISGDHTICDDGGFSFGTIAISLEGIPPYDLSYTHTDDNGTITTDNETGLTTDFFTFESSSPGIFELASISDNSGCTGKLEGSASISVNPLPTVTVTGGGIICLGDSISVEYTLEGNSPFTLIPSYNGAPISVENITGLNYQMMASQEGLYSSFFLQDINGCIGIIDPTIAALVQITPPSVLPSVADTAVCIGSNVTLESSNGSSYDWFSDRDAQTSVQANSSSFMIADIQENVSYFVQATSTTGCPSPILEVHITALDNPDVKYDVIGICEGDDIILSNKTETSGGALFTWDITGNGLALNSNSTHFVHVFDTPGNFNVTLDAQVSYPIGETIITCEGNVTGILEIAPIPKSKLIIDSACFGSPVLIDFDDSTNAIVSRRNFILGNGDTLITGENVTFPMEYTYSEDNWYWPAMKVISDKGCTYLDVQQIIIYPQPKADFSFNPENPSTFKPEVNFTDLSTGASSSEEKDLPRIGWDLGDGTLKRYQTGETFEHSFNADALYDYPVKLVIENDFGCTDSITKIVTTNPDWAIYVPNTFSPNGDNTNDTFFAKGFGIDKFEMWIFDRWGEQVFHSDDISTPWIGNHESKNLSDILKMDTYTYRIEILNVIQKSHVYLGEVNLIR